MKNLKNFSLASFTFWFLILLSILPIIDRAKNIFWGFDLFTHFRIHYLYILMLLIILIIIIKRFHLLPLAFVAIFINLALLNPFHPITMSKKEITDLSNKKIMRVLFYNINWEKDNSEKSTNYIKEIKPDIVILAELTPSTYLDYKERLSSLEYIYTKYSPNPNIEEPANGIALYSKIKPIDNIKVIIFEKWTCPSLQIDITLNNKTVSIIGTHPYSPINKRRTKGRDIQFHHLSNYIRNLNNDIILLGDFNTTTWQKEFKELIKEANLLDTTDKFGFQPTWPTNLPSFLRLAIDHILYTKGIYVTNKFTGEKLNSDHLPIVTDFTTLD